MKASAFSYARANSVLHALQLLAAHGERAKVLSGGQSLMPAMNLRLISPEIIVDIGQLGELRGISVKGDVVVIGALTRHVDLQTSSEIFNHAPLLRDAIVHVAHPAIRNRGTVGGSLAQADPAAELPACMVALKATIVVCGPGGERRIAAREFFTGIYETAHAPQELLIAVEVPIARTKSVHFFQEFARRRGDYAIVGLAALAQLDGDGFSDLRLSYFALGDRPMLAGAANKLVNVTITPGVLAEAAAALSAELYPHADQQATAAMRRHLATVLMVRCVSTLLGRRDLSVGSPG